MAGWSLCAECFSLCLSHVSLQLQPIMPLTETTNEVSFQSVAAFTTCVHTHTCVCIHVCAVTNICSCLWRPVDDLRDHASGTVYHFDFETRPLTDLTGEQALLFLLSLLPQC